MRKSTCKLTALLLSAILALNGCAVANTDSTADAGSTKETENAQAEQNDEEIKDLVIAKLATGEMATFNILYSQSFSDFENLTNMIDPLLEVDIHGKVAPCLSEEWGTDDSGFTWKFKIRDGIKWVDMNAKEKAACTSYDFATSMEWILNFHKNESSQAADFITMLEGAGEYYEYTKNLPEEEAYALTAGEGSVFSDTVGIDTPDENTIVYHCIGARPYFDSLATCLWPLSQGLVDELGVAGVKAMNNENMWYNGCYTMTSFISGNEKLFVKNPSYWDKDAKLFDTVTVKMVESNEIAYQLYQSGEIDQADLTESTLQSINTNSGHEFYDYLVEKPASSFSSQMHLNYDKYLEDRTKDTNWNTAVANEAFRLSWYYGLDLKNYYRRLNSLNPMSCENEYYAMKGLTYTSDGRDYTELVRAELGLPQLNGETMTRLDSQKAEQYKKQAIEELTSLGVSFPVNVDYYISASNQTALDNANVLAQVFSDGLGDEYVKLNIKTYVTSISSEVLDPHLQSISFNGWGPGYADPLNYLTQEISGDEAGYYSSLFSNINDVENTEASKDLLETYTAYTNMVQEADATIDSLDARYEASAKAEAYMLSHALVLPAYYSVNWCLTKVNPYSKMHAVFGAQNDKMKNWETKLSGYTTEEMKQIVAKYNQSTQSK